MLRLDFAADVRQASDYLSSVASQHIPQAAADALTATAFDARDAVRKTLPQRFTIRRPWVARGIGVERANRTTLAAQVFSRDRFMAAQEYGGAKPDARPIPAGRLAQVAKTHVIPKSQWLGAMKTKRNTFYRAGMLFERKADRSVMPLYLLRPQSRIRVAPRFGMTETVRSVAIQQFRRQFERKLQHALTQHP